MEYPYTANAVEAAYESGDNPRLFKRRSLIPISNRKENRAARMERRRQHMRAAITNDLPGGGCWASQMANRFFRRQNERNEVSVQASLRNRLSEVAVTKDEANSIIVSMRNWNNE